VIAATVLAAGLHAAGAASIKGTPHTDATEGVIFWIFGPLSVLSALFMVFSKNTVHGALLLAGVMLSLAVFYAAEDAPFLAFVQVIVYTGAVMMLFLFVLMLIGVDSREDLAETLRGQRAAALVAGLGFVILLFAGLEHAAIHNSAGLASANADGNVLGIAKLLFTRYVFAFEVTSALLITAALGAMVLAHREPLEPKLSQREQMQARFKTGTHPTPLPGPGVYARHNAVDTPALLPDGSPSELSVPPALVILREEHARNPQPAQLGAKATAIARSATARDQTSGKGQE
jgi:NADH-quinone oxidoreductase subunit J